MGYCLEFILPSADLPSHPFSSFYRYLWGSTRCQKQCVALMNHFALCAHSCSVILLFLSSKGTILSPPTDSGLNLPLALTSQKHGRCDIISKSRFQECSFFSSLLAAPRLLYKKAWVSHLNDEKPCGRESRDPSLQPQSNIWSVHETKQDQPVPSWCTNWL